MKTTQERLSELRAKNATAGEELLERCHRGAVHCFDSIEARDVTSWELKKYLTAARLTKIAMDGMSSLERSLKDQISEELGASTSAK